MKIFCVGIGGIGMSAIAQILKSQGHHVQGSDMSNSVITEQLRQDGILVHSEHLSGNIDASIDLLIYSEAVPEENPERKQAKKLGINSINYAEGLAMISQGKKLVAIAGTHGKTTVTGMLTSILKQAKENATIVIGSRIETLGGKNFQVGEGDIFLAEACEYRDNFLTLAPEILVINNLEPDHLDYFQTPKKYYESFQTLSEKIPQHGKLMMFENDSAPLALEKIHAEKILLSNQQLQGQKFALKVPGLHNQKNALVAATVAKELGISEQDIARGLENFPGTWRRFEHKGFLKFANLYDDYGHHPTEVKATLQGARELFPNQKITVIFQPHQYSRTKKLFADFLSAFNSANEVWITDIYQARDTEEDKASVSAKQLACSLEHSSCQYVPFEDIVPKIIDAASSGQVFILMGAGSITQVFNEIQNHSDWSMEIES